MAHGVEVVVDIVLVAILAYRSDDAPSERGPPPERRAADLLDDVDQLDVSDSASVTTPAVGD
jgi:hypothetical protein